MLIFIRFVLYSHLYSTKGSLHTAKVQYSTWIGRRIASAEEHADVEAALHARLGAAAAEREPPIHAARRHGLRASRINRCDSFRTV